MLRKALVAVEAVAVVSVAVLAVTWWVWGRTPPYRPFGDYRVPQTILHRKPFYRPGDTFTTMATKCYRGKKLIPFTGLSYYVRETPSRLTVPNNNGASVVDPAQSSNGCFTSTFDHAIPLLPPGRWRLEGQETARLGTQTVTAAWYTQDFLVR